MFTEAIFNQDQSDVTQFLQSTGNRGTNKWSLNRPSGKSGNTDRVRQPKVASFMQMRKNLAAAHIFQPTVGVTPVKPIANMS
jgi:hypothetical protein